MWSYQSNLELEVHEEDIVKHYGILKPYLLLFAGERLPSNQDHQAWWHCIVCHNLHFSFFGPQLLSKPAAGSFGGGHGLCGGDHEPLWRRSLHPPGGSRKSEGDPWFCSFVGDVQFLKCAHGYVMWPCMFMTSFCYRSGLILKGASWSWWHNTSLTWRTEPSKPGPMYVSVHNMCQSTLRI